VKGWFFKPCKITGKYIVLFVLILMFFNGKWNGGVEGGKEDPRPNDTRHLPDLVSSVISLCMIY